MYSRATAGDRFNNDKFSPCSYGNITAVLQQKRKCFVSSDAPICGNQEPISAKSTFENCVTKKVLFVKSSYSSRISVQILKKLVDQNEECDCGFEDDCKKVGDNCCYPADHPEKRLRCKRKTDPRTRRPYQCSPSEGPCCESATCSFKLGIKYFLPTSKFRFFTKTFIIPP